MMLTAETAPHLELDQWVRTTVSRATDLNRENIYALIDLAQSPYPILNSLQCHVAVPPYTLLLDDTPHQDIAGFGPVLIQIGTQQPLQQQLLIDLLYAIEGEPRLMLLIPARDYLKTQLIKTLRRSIQVECGQGGEKTLLLRYYDPRCFMALLNTLEDAALKLLLAPVQEWHWLNRDGQPSRLQQPDHIGALPDWPHPVLHLSEQAICHLSAWHQAELWRQDYHLTPADLNLNNQEALMELLVTAQLAADKQNQLSQPERVAFIQHYLAMTVGTPRQSS